nr:odorant receptor SameORX [Schistocerca americana]
MLRGRRQTAATLEDVQDLVSPNAAMLRLLGLWRAPASDGEGVGGALALMRGWLCCAMVGFASVTTGAKLCMDTPEELTALTDCGYSLLRLSAITVKVACFILQRTTLQELVKQLADIRNIHGRRRANCRVRSFYQRRATIVYRTLQVLVMTVICGWITAPLLQHKKADEIRDSRKVERQTPLPIWLPLDLQRSPTYEIIYVVQALCGTAAVQLSMLLDTSFYKLTLLVTAELQVLNDNLAVLGRADVSAERRGSFPTAVPGQERDGLDVSPIKQTAVPVTENNDRSRKLLYFQLLENVRHHQAIIKCFQLLQSALNYSISILLLTNILTVCFAIFVASVMLQSDGGLRKAMKTITSIPTLLCETGMFCIFGQMVVDQSERLARSAYSCSWVDADARFKRALLILETRASQPLEFSVGKLIKLSRETFLKILNSSYTLISLLYQFQVPKD